MEPFKIAFRAFFLFESSSRLWGQQAYTWVNGISSAIPVNFSEKFQTWGMCHLIVPYVPDRDALSAVHCLKMFARHRVRIFNQTD